MGDTIDLEKFRDKIDRILKVDYETDNIFKILHQETYENKHSTFLSWLFNPKAKHGFDNRFAQAFFDEVCGENKLDASKIERVITEKSIDGAKQKEQNKNRKRIDILIVGKDFTCTIENKYGSGEHGGQCADYREYIEGRRNKNERPEGGEYPISDGWNNYFVFLDINNPEDFDDNQDKRYASFTLFKYDQIIDILLRLYGVKELQEIEEKNIQDSFIKQYISILKDNYIELDKKYADICDEIEPEDVQKIIKIKVNDNYSYEYVKFITIVKKYYDQIYKTINQKIKPIVERIVPEDYIKRDYGRGNYALGINASKDINDPCFKTIDYRPPREGLDGISIALFAGLEKGYSKKLCDYICTSEFEEKNKFFKKFGFVLDKQKGTLNSEKRICDIDNIWITKFQLWVRDGGQGSIDKECPANYSLLMKKGADERRKLLNENVFLGQTRFEEMFSSDNYVKALVKLRDYGIFDEASFNEILEHLIEFFILNSFDKISKDDTEIHNTYLNSEHVLWCEQNKNLIEDEYKKYEFCKYEKVLDYILSLHGGDRNTIIEKFKSVLRYKSKLLPLVKFKKEKQEEILKEFSDKYQKDITELWGDKEKKLILKNDYPDYYDKWDELSKINDDSNKLISSGWSLNYIYVLNQAESEKTETLEKIFIEKTYECLVPFNYENDFLEIIRKSSYFNNKIG